MVLFHKSEKEDYVIDFIFVKHLSVTFVILKYSLTKVNFNSKITKKL